MNNTTEDLRSQEVEVEKRRFPFWLWALVPTALSGQMLLPLTAWGQAITPDGTLPTQVMQDGDNYNIEGGGRAGGNLFHSFQEFSVPTGGEAFFNNAVDVDNIFSRVTGGNVSNIDGLIRANGGANLFLINPAGIVFGPNARLNIGGSFLGSSASSLIFPGGIEFSATDTQSTPLLTINAPIGLGFRENPGRIVVQGQLQNLVGGIEDLLPPQETPPIRVDERIRPTAPEEIATPVIDAAENLVNLILSIPDLGPRIKPGKTLALVGGEVALEGGQLRAPQGRVELGSVAGNNQVSITPTDRGWALGYEEVERFQDIIISGLALVDVSGVGSGEVQVRGSNVTIADLSFIFGVTQENINGGKISINAENLNIQENSLVGAFATVESSGNSGNLTFETENMKIENSIIFSSVLGRGNSGNLTVKAEGGSVELTGTLLNGRLPAGLTVATANDGSGGTLMVETGQLIVRDGAQVSATTGGNGQGGTVEVRASDFIELSGESANGQLFSSGLFAASFGTGEAGDVRVETGRLTVRDGGYVSASTRRGKGGSVNVTASESIEVSGTTRDGQFESSLLTLAIGGEGENVDDNPQGGNLQINTRRLTVSDGGQISASGFGTGGGGTVEVTASESIELIGQSADGRFKSGLFAQASLLPELDDIDKPRVAGNLRISTGELIVRDGAEITVSREGLVGAISAETGAAGNLTVSAGEISLDNGTLRADTTAGQGNITLTAEGRIELRNDSTISTDATGTATGGNITISTDFLIAFPEGDNDIRANAQQGQGGQVNITADGVFAIDFRERPNSRTNDITASSESGPQGEVRPIILNADIIQGLVELSENVVDPNEIVAQACGPNRTGGSSLIETGRGGLPPTPYDPLTDDTIRVGGVVAPPRLADLPDPEQVVTKVERTEEIASDDIQPARGWFVNEKGNIVLTPYPTPNATGRHPGARPGCGPVRSQK